MSQFCMQQSTDASTHGQVIMDITEENNVLLVKVRNNL